MALSAAELQKKHELEGAPDPFPSLGPDTPARPRAQASNFLDTESEAAFPSLSSATPVVSRTNSSVWNAASGPRIKSTTQRAPVFVDSFTLSAIDLSHTGKDGKPTTLGDVMRQVMAKYKVKIEASANQRARQTTFHLKAESQKELDKAKRSLLALLSPVVTLVINAPASTIPSIIGPRGATLKQIRDQTSVRIDIPKREATPPVTGINHTNGKVDNDDEDEELTIPVTLVGPQPLALEAQTMLKQIIASRAPKYKQRIRDIPVHVMPFVFSRYTDLASDQVNLSLNSEIREITLTGDREAVTEVVEAVKRMISELEASITSIKLSLPQRQHRLLTGAYADDVMKQSNCAVFIGQGAEVIVWGHGPDLAAGLTAVMAQANSKYIHEFPLPGPKELSKQLTTYFARIHLERFIKSKYPDVETFLPSPQSESELLSIDLVGNKAEVDASVKVIAELIGKLIGGIREVPVDWLLHRVIIGKNAKWLKQLYETLSIQVYFPNESLELSQVLLVHDPITSATAISPNDKRKCLDDVEKELLKLAREAANVKTEILAVEKRWHDAVLGNGRTTLNALIGEDTTLSIKVGAEATNPAGEDVIVVRGISSEVDRVVKEILQIAEDAKNDEIVNSYSTDFEIDKEYVGRVVGSQGAGVNKLRDQLGVRVDVFDEVDEKDEKGRKKKLTHQKCRIKITGRKENAEEAKKRILAQVERLADETAEILKIPSQYHSSLIGQGGKYAIRLEEKYGVKITFPRHSSEADGKTREQLKADEVLVKGGKKGVAGAKSELLEALEYEKENNNVIKFMIPTRSVARVLGRGGASINEIKDQTDAQIDIDKGSEDNPASTTITLRGTKKAIAGAKSAILAISAQVVDEITVLVTVESKFHRNIIGAGGQGLKDLIAECGGPTDSKLHAGLIRFPRHGEPSDEVRLRGEPSLIAKLKVELEKIVVDLRDRVVLGVDVPVAQHRILIGRGGQNLNELQNKFHVQIQIPGSRTYEHVGKPENVADLSDVDPANIVKVSGARAACEKAIARLQAPAEIAKEITVPLKYHNAISQQGSFFRSLRNFGVFVEHSVLPTKSGIPSRVPAARVDETESGESEWEIVSNYQDTDEGDSTWTLKARDQAGLERAEELIQEAINHASTLTHVGFLTLPDRSLFPKIVGTKGANVARLRNETGADITVSRENSTIVITGTEAHVIAAKDAILRMNGRGPRRSE